MILEINNQVVDLPTSGRGLLKLQKSVAALSDLETRTGEYSWDITLPPTRRNAGVFGQLLHAQTLDKFTGAYTFRLRSGGEEWRGVFLLKSLQRGYRGNLSMEGFSWARALGEKKLTDLASLRAIAYDGSQLPTILQQNCDSTDLQFPLVAYGNYFAPAIVKTLADGTEEETAFPAGAGLGPEPLAVDDYPPSVYYLNVLRAIFQEAGYFLQSPLLTDPELRSWCITAAGSNGDFWPWGSLLPAASEATVLQQQRSYFETTNPYGTNKYNTAAGIDETNQVRYFMPATPTVVAKGGTRALSAGKPQFLAPTEGVYSFAWTATIGTATQFIDEQNNRNGARYAPHFAPVVLGLVVFRAGAGYENADGGICTNGTGDFDPEQLSVVSYHRLDAPGSFGLKTGAFQGEVAGLYLETGDTVRLLVFTRVQYEKAGDGLNKYTRKEFHFTTTAVSFACTAFEGPTLLNPAKVLPPLLQKDVVKDFLVKTNTVPVVDVERRIITLLSREGHTQAQGEPLQLDSFTDPATLEYYPVLGGAGKVVFAPALASDDFILVAGSQADARATEPDQSERYAEAAGLVDVVSVGIAGGVAETEKRIESCFAATGLRTYTLGTQRLALPTVASKGALATPRSEVNAADVSGATPRVVRYLGLDDSIAIPFIPGAVAWAKADYAGPLAWAGDAGAVAQYYRGFLDSAARGNVCRASAALSPARYAQLRPGRRVWLLGAEYQVEKLEGFDPENPASPTTLELLRRV